MRALALDFVSRCSALRRMAMLLCGVGLLADVGLAYRYYGLQAELSRALLHRQALLQVQHPPAVAEPTAAMQAQARGAWQGAQRVIVQLALPWNSLFQQIDASVDEHVTLLGVEPDGNKRQLRISAEARNLQDMLDYERRLHDLPSLQAVYVLSHRTQLTDPQKPIRFDISAEWRTLTGGAAQAEAPRPGPLTMVGAGD